MTPESIGLSQSNIVLGKHSGRHAVKNRLREMGYNLSEAEIDQTYQRFIELADKKKEVTDSDLEALVRNEIQFIADKYELDYLHVSTGNSTIPTATIRLKVDGTPVQEASCGHGPIDAIYKAIDRITKLTVKLDEYNIKAVTSGEDALGEVVVKVR